MGWLPSSMMLLFPGRNISNDESIPTVTSASPRPSWSTCRGRSSTTTPWGCSPSWVAPAVHPPRLHSGPSDSPVTKQSPVLSRNIGTSGTQQAPGLSPLSIEMIQLFSSFFSSRKNLEDPVEYAAVKSGFKELAQKEHLATHDTAIMKFKNYVEKKPLIPAHHRPNAHQLNEKYRRLQVKHVDTNLSSLRLPVVSGHARPLCHRRRRRSPRPSSPLLPALPRHGRSVAGPAVLGLPVLVPRPVSRSASGSHQVPMQGQ